MAHANTIEADTPIFLALLRRLVTQAHTQRNCQIQCEQEDTVNVIWLLMVCVICACVNGECSTVVYFSVGLDNLQVQYICKIKSLVLVTGAQNFSRPQ